MIKAVLWDFGGVITTSPFEAFNRFEEQHQIPKDFIRGINATNPETNAWAQFESSQVTYDEFDKFKKQYDGDKILNRLKTFGESKKFFRVLGVIDQDIFTRLVDYRFGCAKFSEDPSNGVALISIFRLKESFYKRIENLHLLELRMLKEALHELGHSFGLSLDDHCQNQCVMNFSENVGNIEQKPSFFCLSCINKLDAYFKDL